MNIEQIITLALVIVVGGFMILGAIALVIDTTAEIIRDRKIRKQWNR